MIGSLPSATVNVSLEIFCATVGIVKLLHCFQIKKPELKTFKTSP